MKKYTILLAAVLLLILTAGCGRRETPGASSSASSSAAASQEEPLTIEDLTVELPRGLDTGAAKTAVNALPALMSRCGVEIRNVTVTYGTSYAATAEALDQGGVQLAFFPAAELVRCGGGAVPILADARQTLSVDSTDPTDWNTGCAAEPEEGWTAGVNALLCAAPTDYGRNLASRVQSGKTLSWTELNHAHWGVLSGDSLAGSQCVQLWLEDNYEDNDLTDLNSVTVYDGWEELLRAAADGRIDLFPLPPDLRSTYEDLWTMEKTKTDAGGARGFGRTEPIYEELPVVGVTGRLYSFVAAVTPEDAAVNSETFRLALEQALEQAFPSEAERLAALGAEHYAPVAPGDLNGLRRLLLGER